LSISRRQLLTHTSGFGYASGDPDLVRWAKHTGRRDKELQGAIEQWNTPLKFAPGQGWYYGVGCDWAGQVLEQLTQRTLGAFMQERVFDPLGMNDTTLRPDALPHIQHRLVPTAHRDPETGELTSGEGSSRRVGAVDSGGAGLYTTAGDYAKLLRSLLASLAGQESSLQICDGPTNSHQMRKLGLTHDSLTVRKPLWLMTCSGLGYRIFRRTSPTLRTDFTPYLLRYLLCSNEAKHPVSHW